MSRVLVTGGAGTIGAAVVRRLAGDPEFEVRVSDQREAPAWMREACEVHTGNLLDPADTATSPTYTQQVNTLIAQGHADAAARYSRGNSIWCAGDQDINGRTVTTSYVVRAPDGTPFDNLDNPIVCGITFDDYSEEVYPLLNQADGYRNGTFRVLERLKAPARLLFGPWSHMATDTSLPGPRIDLVPEMARWWDRWLRDEGNGVDQAPPDRGDGPFLERREQLAVSGVGDPELVEAAQRRPQRGPLL